MVQELVERYMARARKLLDGGATQEAIPWLREVLQLDRSRKDVARMIRDLRYDEVAFKRSKRRRARTAVSVLAVSLGVALAGLREVKVRQGFAELPPAKSGDVASLRERLSALEDFIAAQPVWHGALTALKERSEVRVELDRLNTEEMARRERQAQERRKNDQLADAACARARGAADAGDFEAALREFQAALELASGEWAYRERTLRDVDAVVAYLGREGGG
jgi:tetratricopeptide (TPR) repeat protein